MPRVLFVLLLIRATVGVLAFERLVLWLGVIGTVGVTWGVLEAARYYLAKRHRTSLPAVVFWFGLAAAADMGGNAYDWYNQFLRYDNVVHFLGGLAMVFLLLSLALVLAQARYPSIPHGWVVYLAFVTTIFLGTLMELFEYVADMSLNINYWLGSGGDTVIDLAVNMLGALVGCALFTMTVPAIVHRGSE